MEKMYPKSHVMMIMGLNALSFIVGLALATGPFVQGLLPGSYDTTVHVAVGALIAVLAVFRLLLAYGAIWIDIVLAALGLITFMMPTFQHKRYITLYNLGHMAAGGLVIIVAAISLVATLAVLKKVVKSRA